MKTLPLMNIATGDHLLFPDELFDIGLHTSATRLMTDFRKVRPHVVDANLSAAEARSLMHKMHISLCVVIDEDLEFAGLIGLSQLSEEAIIRRIANGEKRDDIQVREMMLQRDEIKAVEYAAIKELSVAGVIETLKLYGEKYCMVVNSDDHTICGMFAVSELSRRLHQPISIDPQLTFAELVTTIAH